MSNTTLFTISLILSGIASMFVAVGIGVGIGRGRKIGLNEVLMIATCLISVSTLAIVLYMELSDPSTPEPNHARPHRPDGRLLPGTGDLLP